MVGGAVAPLLINRISQDARFASHPGYTQLGIESYIAVPLNRRDGSRFGTLCALDPLPADLETADLETFSLLAELIAFEQDAEEERERREVEEEERRSFIDSVAHDLKSPLQVIKSQAQMLQRQIRRGRDIGQDVLVARLGQIEASVNRSTNLIDEMLDASRLRSGRPLELALKLVSRNSVVDGVVAEYREVSRHHSFRVEQGDAEVVGIWNPSRVTRVVGNVVSNGIRYSPKGGEITIGVHRDDSPDEAHAVLTITDEGIGIPAEDLPYIFETHRRGRNVEGRMRGTGIGLAGSKQIIEQHGGTIAVESTEGEGSTFTLWLPINGVVGEPIHSVEVSGVGR